MFFMMVENIEERNKLELLYDLYKQGMFYVANSILHNESDSEDTVHDAFVKVIDLLDRIENPRDKKARNLLYIITEHIAIDKYRYKKRHNVVELDEDIPDESDDYEGVITAMMVEKSVAKLSSKYRNLLFLRYGMEMSEQEIAENLSMTEANVHKTLQRAKKSLRSILEQEG